MTSLFDDPPDDQSKRIADLEGFVNRVWATGWHALGIQQPGHPYRHVDTYDSPSAWLGAAKPYVLSDDTHVWIMVNGMAEKPPHRGGNLDITSSRVLSMDLDHKSPMGAHADADLPTSDEVKAALAGLGELQPNIVVLTGFGRQAHWLLATELKPDERQDQLLALADKLQGAAPGLRIERLDLAGMFRVPGSFNVKVTDDPRLVIYETNKTGPGFTPEYIAKRCKPVKAPALTGGSRHTPGAVTTQQKRLLDFLRDNHGAHNEWATRDGQVRITRPGKAGEGHSGNIWTGVDGDAIATIFSTDWPVIGPKTPTEPQSWALDPIGILRHPGDPRSGVSIPAAAITTEVGDYQEGLEYIDWSKTQQPADDLVERLIIPHRWVQFIAPAKAGKSSLEMFIAIELSEGREPFEQSSVTPVPTIWLDGEMGETDLAELIDACGHDPAQLPNLHCSTNHPRLDSPLGAQRLLKDVDRWNARLVIVDGLNSFIQPEKSENDTNTWLPFFQHTVVPLKARGVALLSGDNMGKEEERGARGSSAKNDKADAVIHIKPDRQGIGVTLKAIHSRGGAYIDQPLKLAAEGFDRSTHIRYWRASLSWPAGTSQAVKVLDDLQVPFDMGRSKVRETLIAAGKTMSNEVLAAAIRWRKANILPQGTSGGLTTSQTRTGVRTVLVRDGQVLQTDPDNVP